MPDRLTLTAIAVVTLASCKPLQDPVVWRKDVELSNSEFWKCVESGPFGEVSSLTSTKQPPGNPAVRSEMGAVIAYDNVRSELVVRSSQALSKEQRAALEACADPS